ncbi:MAG TPA: LPS export ABC transporter periplasmic protein LptC [Candidatus Baltobacteraceae bacterium]
MAAPKLARVACAGLICAFVTACAPKPPPQTASSPSVGPSPSPTSVTTPAPTASPTPLASVSNDEPVRAISRGTSREPARYIVRNPHGQVMYDVRSSTVVYDRASDGTAVATFTTPHVTFASPDGRVVIADSPKAVAHDRDKSVVMTGGVHAKTSDSKVLTCTTLTYDELHAQILCVGNVVLTDTKTNQSATGETLQTDPGFEHVTLSGS